MRNTNTTVASDRNRLDFAVEKFGTEKKSIRYDVTNVDLGNGEPVVTTALMGLRYRFTPNVPAQAAARAACGGNQVDYDHILDNLDEEDVVNLGLGNAVEIDGRTYYSLRQWLDANPAPRGGRGVPGCNPRVPGRQCAAEGEPLAVTRVSPRLVALLGFTPRAAYRV